MKKRRSKRAFATRTYGKRNWVSWIYRASTTGKAARDRTLMCEINARDIVGSLAHENEAMRDQMHLTEKDTMDVVTFLKKKAADKDEEVESSSREVLSPHCSIAARSVGRGSEIGQTKTPRGQRRTGNDRCALLIAEFKPCVLDCEFCSREAAARRANLAARQRTRYHSSRLEPHERISEEESSDAERTRRGSPIDRSIVAFAIADLVV